MSDARLPWDPFQREVLEALGHVVYAAQDRAALEAQAADAADAGAPPLMAVSRPLPPKATVPVPICDGTPVVPPVTSSPGTVIL